MCTTGTPMAISPASALAQNVWSFAGQALRGDVNPHTLQPFVNHYALLYSKGK
jgi:hypothetical protein